ncbi:SPARC-related modular calcium-binding protein 1 [Condylostylus longicornis]|uniref:SPARC-related modular calcium-binding protein 1 n=1 Tax=Condylostylus longicornis TaxID=2530218 RepID=UPI00244E28C3|nr:SPARC-related modular calcium-binding protein 1 [Condylostylus longicornis]
MIIRSFMVLFLFINIGLTAAPDKEKKEPPMSECAAKGGECDEQKHRPVCGTDNRTYPSRCHLIRTQCQGNPVKLKHAGACKKECLEVRQYALKTKTPYHRFIPKCRPDGSYAAIQCLENTGCWCSDSTGKPIPDTSTRNGKPNCRRYTRSNTRRSPSKNMMQRNRRPCTQADQAEFNNNLINIFVMEYKRYQSARDPLNPPKNLDDKIVLEWKFISLDLNKNQMLDKIEFRELKRLIKKVIKPKRCARLFGKYCDVDTDESLTRAEWSNCLTRDGINRGVFNRNANGASPHSITSTLHHLDDSDDGDEESSQHLEEYEDEDYEEDDGHAGSDTIGSPSRNLSPNPAVILLSVRPEPHISHNQESEAEISDCTSDRAAALEEQNNGGGSMMYVPECTPDGRYQRVQCYRSTGYCWCVHEDTGKNIPGTSVKDKIPACDSVYQTSRPMKGCPEPKKLQFLKDLKDFLKKEVTSKTNLGSNRTIFSSEDEKYATLSFVYLDKNKNSVWERKEWKIFREMVSEVKPLRKCGKKMPRYCDVNSDKKITLAEWLNCMQTERDTDITRSTTVGPTKLSKLNGPNPLHVHLKE